MSVVLVVDDTKPDISIRFRDLPAGISVAQAVFRLKRPDGTILERNLTEQAGRWVGSFGAGDLAQPGRMLADVKAILSDGGVQHGRDPIEVIVRPEFFQSEMV